MNTNTTNNFLRYFIYVLLAVTLFVPLIVADGNFFSSMFFPFITGKAFIFRIFVEIAFAGWLVLAFSDKDARPKISPVTVGLTIFTFVVLILDLTGVNPIRSLWSNFERMEGWVTIIHMWAYFIVFTSVVKTREHWHRFFNVSFVAAFFVALWGIMQLTGHAAIHQSADRLDASIGNSEYLAVYMLMNAFLALYMSVVSWGKRKSTAWIYLALAALYSFIVFGTQTRGAVLALGAGLLAGLIIFVFGKENKNAIESTSTETTSSQIRTSRERIVATSLLVLIVIIVGGFYLARNTHFVQSHPTFQRIASISINNPRIQYIWPEAWQGFKEKPILGWGQENFNYVFNKYYNPGAWGQEQWFDRAHNVFIDWAINGGIIGFASYVALFILAVISIWKSSFNLKERAVLTALLLAYAVHNMFVFDNLVSYIMFFLVLGFLSSEWHSRRVVAEGAPGLFSKTEAYIRSIDVEVDIVNWIIVPVVVVVFFAAFYFVSWRPINENLSLIDAMINCQYAGQTGAPVGDVNLFTKALSGPYIGLQETREQLFTCTENIINAKGVTDNTKLAYYEVLSKSFADQEAATPSDLRGYIFAGSFYNGLSQWQIALPYLRKAYEISPVKQSVLFALAQNYISGATSPASTTDGVALLATAYNEAPDYPQAQVAYAEGLYLTGQYQDAAKIYKVVVATNPTDYQSMASLAAAYTYLHEPELAISELQLVASGTPQSADIVAKYISQIKAGQNPFLPPATSTKNK